MRPPRSRANGSGFTITCLLALALALPAAAQEDSGASLTIGFAEGAGWFHAGEAIPVELSFKASTAGQYDISTVSYDRSGRLNMEQFHVTPAGRDPLASYYSFGGFVGGGLGGETQLTSKPYVMREDLNEWVALDKAGHYSLYVTSVRVTRAAGKSEWVTLRSNTLDFDVLEADPAWQQQTLETAMAVLDSPSSGGKEKIPALRTLRFLDTPASIHELVHLMGIVNAWGNWDEMAGLAGSRNQDLVLRELDEQMSAPDVGITSNYLYIFGKLKFLHNRQPLPPYPEQGDAEEQSHWRERAQADMKEFEPVQADLMKRASTLLSLKQGRARAETVETLLIRQPRPDEENNKPFDGLPPDEVTAAFLGLSVHEQWDLLYGWVWERLKDPAMIAPLKQIAEQPSIHEQGLGLRDLALRRLFELDPNAARPIFFEEMRHPHVDSGMFTVKGDTLGLLPDETLPQFDQMFAARLEQRENRSLGLDAQLIGRYATAAILPRIKTLYEASAKKSVCEYQDGFVRYFLRTDPDYGVSRLNASQAFCMKRSLKAVIQMGRWNEVEPGLIAHLDDANLLQASEAAAALAQYGSAQAQQALWDRLRRFHAEWAKRENELTTRPGASREASDAVGFQNALVGAIGSAPAWLLTEEQVAQLENLALGQVRNNVKRWHAGSVVGIGVSFFGEAMTADVSQYSQPDLDALKAKLAQYPRGTKFSLSIQGSKSQRDAVRFAINEVAARHGLEVSESEPPK